MIIKFISLNHNTLWFYLAVRLQPQPHPLQTLMLILGHFCKVILKGRLIRLMLVCSILLILFSMFFKKKRSPAEPPQQKQQIHASPLPKLQQLTKLEGQFISIIGKKNMAFDEEADIFTRLEEIYFNSLQGSPLGMEMIEKCLKIIGEMDSPIRSKFLYFYAHEMKLKGAAADELEPVLLESFHSNLALRNKLRIGFKAGLVFCQISDHAAEVDKVLSSLIVSLEHELNYKPQRQTKVQSSSTYSSSQTTKAIYLGSPKLASTRKPHPRETPSKHHRLQLFKLLFEAFITGEWRVNSQAKRKYYMECGCQLKGKMMRQFLGKEIEKKLNYIEYHRSVTLQQFSQPFKINCNQEIKEGRPCTPSKDHSRYQQSYNPYQRSKSQIAFTKSASLKSSFVEKENLTFQSTWGAPRQQTAFKLHIRSKSKQKKEKSQRTHEEGPPPQITRLIFKETPQNAKEIILKFDRLNQNKTEVKKTKIKQNFHWQKQIKQKQKCFQRVIDITCLPQIKQEPSSSVLPNQHQAMIQNLPESSFQVKIQPKQLQSEPALQQQNHIIPQSIKKLQIPFVETFQNEGRQATIPSLSSMTSRQMDIILQEGLESIQDLDSRREHPPIVSNSEFSECEVIQQQHIKHDLTHLLQEEKEVQQIEEKSYKIIIQPLEQLPVNPVIIEQPSSTLPIDKPGDKEKITHERRESRRSSTLRRNSLMKQYEVSIQIKSSLEPQPSLYSNIQRSSKLVCSQEIQNHSQLVSETKTIQQKQTHKFQNVCPSNQAGSGNRIMNCQLEQSVKEGLIGSSDIQLVEGDPCFELDCQEKDDKGGYNQTIYEWLIDIYGAISNEICNQEFRRTTQECRTQLRAEVEIFIRNLGEQIEKKYQYSKPIPIKPSQALNLPVQKVNRQSLFLHLSQFDIYDSSHLEASKIQQKNDFQDWRSQDNFIEELLLNQENIVDDQFITPPQLQPSPQPHKSDTQSPQLNQAQAEPNKGKEIFCQEFEQVGCQQKELPSHSFKKEGDRPTLNENKVIHLIKKFTHWLQPQLTIDDERLTFLIMEESTYSRQAYIPLFLTINDDVIKHISSNIDMFLLKYPESQEINRYSLQKDFAELQLLPSELQLKTFSITETASNQSDQISVVASLKDSMILLKSNLRNTKHYPLYAGSQQHLDELIREFQQSQVSVKDGQLLIANRWRFVKQKNIKLREKAQNLVHHFVFSVLEKYIPESQRFTYRILQQCKSFFEIEQIQEGNRQNILKNIDTIIGFCLKTHGGKIEFNTFNIHQLISIL